MADVERPELTPDDRHHLERVLRLRAGEQVTVSDGAGRWRVCRFGPGPELVPDGQRDGQEVGDVVVEPAPSPPIAVAFALIKGERPELTVQKLTELGVDRIVPFTAARSVVRWTGRDRVAANVERLRRVAREAASQSRRAWLPAVDGLATFADLVAEPGAALADPDGGPPILTPPPLVLVGPEGGWSDEELARADERGVPRIRLGPQVLRAETASIAVGALLAALRDGIVAEN